MVPTRLRALLLPSLLALAVAACGPASSSSPAASLPAASPTESAAAYPLTLTDDAGRTVVIPAEPERIVSLAPSNTEIVCALGACGQLVGVTDFDDYPAQVADVADVVIGGSVDVEQVVAAQPQLILAAGNELIPTTIIDQLTSLGFPVLSLYPNSLDDVYDDILLVGAAIHEPTAAAELVASMQLRAEAVGAAVTGAERPRVFYEVGLFEGTIYTAGEDSFIASLITIAGGEPITGDAVSTAIQLEDLIDADPQLILLGDAAYDASVTPGVVAARVGWGEMTAVSTGQIVVMLDDLLVTRPGPRVVDGLEALARAIHPGLVD